MLLALAISNMSSAIEILQDRMNELGKIAVENIASTNPIMHRHNSYKDNLLVASNGNSGNVVAVVCCVIFLISAAIIIVLNLVF